MSIDILKTVDIIEILENYISHVRPEPKIRTQLDLGYEIENQSIILTEIRPVGINRNKFWSVDMPKQLMLKVRTFGKYTGCVPMVTGIYMGRCLMLKI